MSQSNGHLSIARRAISLLLGEPGDRPFDVRYWDGSCESGKAGQQQFSIVLRTPWALRNMLLPPSELSIAEALISGDVEIEGDMEAAALLADVVGRVLARPGKALRLATLLFRLPAGDRGKVRSQRFVRPDDQAPRAGGAAEIRHHYDVSNAFYALWLDGEMQYTCAYFRTGTESLDQAQRDKLELICRKLRLREGERLLDIGCGWGGLVRYAAARYGVRAHGITLSAAQAEYARARIAREGLGSSCSVEVRDYRDLPLAAEYDKIVAVGVTEHVAAESQPAYFAAAHRALKPGGVFLNHCEVSVQRARARTAQRRIADRLWRRDQFIERYVFPDARLVPAAHVIASAEKAGFELRDVESLREHYTLTLRQWVKRLEASRAEAVALVGEHTYRVWRLYMAAGAAGFATGRINIIQTLLSKPDAAGRSRLPLTRDDLLGAQPVTAARRLPAA